jgi:hypothetical protein
MNRSNRATGRPVLRVGGIWIALAIAALPRTAPAQTKTFINYFQQTPITCPLTTNTWGCTATGSTPANCVSGAGVVPRDTCNGIESPRNPPQYYYWDGKIIRAADGVWHLFADRWPGTSGFGAWTSSDPIHAVGDGGVLGPFTDTGYAYSDSAFGGDPHHGHNSSVVALSDGSFAMVVSEVVPFTIFTSPSLDGPWTPCSENPGAGLSVPGTGFGGNNSYGSNVSLAAAPNGTFEIVQRHGLIATSSVGVCGPYKAQQPTNTYPSSEAIPSASAASIYPNRQKHLDPQGPATVESTYALAEDPVIWYSGGQYHVLYDYPDDRVGYHLTSIDGVHDWTDRGLAYDPRYAQQIFSYTDGTVDHWYKMERPGVVLENGHVTHVTFAVSDVDKNNQIPAGSDHGSKVIAVPFDGAQLDCDIGDGGCDVDAGPSPGTDGGGPGAVSDASAGEGGATGSGTTTVSSSASAVSSGTSSRSESTRGGSSGGGSGGSGSAEGTASSTGTGSGGEDSAERPIGGSGCGCFVGPRWSDAGAGGGFLALMAVSLVSRARRARRDRGRSA